MNLAAFYHDFVRKAAAGAVSGVVSVPAYRGGSLLLRMVKLAMAGEAGRSCMDRDGGTVFRRSLLVCEP